MSTLLLIRIMFALTVAKSATHTSDLCIPWHSDLAGFELDVSVLPKSAKVFVCDNARPSQYVLVERFFTRKECSELIHHESNNKVDYYHDPGKETVPRWAAQRVARFLRIADGVLLDEPDFKDKDWDRDKTSWKFLEHDDGDNVAPESLHQDRNSDADRFLSMMAYLTQPQAGGHTLFPFIGNASSWGPTRDEQEVQRYLKMFPDAWEKRDPQNGLIREYGGFNLAQIDPDSVERQQITDKMNSMCAAIRSASEQGSKYPYFGVEPRPGSAMFWWHWKKVFKPAGPEDVLKTWIDVLPDWTPSGWHRRCGAKGKRVSLRLFVHSKGLNCGVNLPAPQGPYRPPRRADCNGNGFLNDGVHGCGKFKCEDIGDSVKITYSEQDYEQDHARDTEL